MTLAIDSNVLSALIGAVGVLVVALLTTWLNKKVAVATARETAKINHQVELDRRLWEMRRTGYSVVIRGLDQLSEEANEIDEMYDGSSPEENERGSFGHSAADGKTWPECQAEFARNQLVFSIEFVKAFRNLESDLKNAKLQMYPSQIAHDEARAFGSAYVRLRRIALKDLDMNESDPEH